MRKEDLKNWTRDMLKDRIIELGGIIEQWKRDNGEMLQIMKKTQNENNELRKRLEKLESDICGTSPCIVSEFHLFEDESWIKASTYDDVLLRLKNANKRITDLEQDMFNKSTEELKQVEKLQSENKSLKDENKALKQQNEYLKSIFESMSMAERPEDVMRKTGLFSEEAICEYMKENETTLQDMKKTVYENDVDRDTLIAELQDQHQQDCIKINQLHVTIDTLVDKYSRLRKTVGMD